MSTIKEHAISNVYSYHFVINNLLPAQPATETETKLNIIPHFTIITV